MKIKQFNFDYRKFLLLAYFLFLNLSTVTCHDERSSIELNSVTFSNSIGTNNYFVKFYAPWCSFCIKLKDTWEELAEMLNEPGSRVTIANVDCTKELEICQKLQITSYPTLLYFKKNEDTFSKYSGTRDLSSLANYLNDQLGTNVVEQEVHPSGPLELTDETYAKHLAQGRHFVKFYAPWCGHCQRLSSTWEGIYQLFPSRDSFSIAKVDCTVHKEACRTYDIMSYPTMLWIENSQKIEKYQGARTIEDMEMYINEKLAQSPENLQVDEVKQEAAPPPVVPMSGDNFQEGIGEGFTFIKFFAPWCGHCKSLAPTWQDLGTKLASKKDITIANVDCTLQENRKLCDEQEIEGFPTLLLYKNGEKVDRYYGTRTLTALSDFVYQHLEKKEHEKDEL